LVNSWLNSVDRSGLDSTWQSNFKQLKAQEPFQDTVTEACLIVANVFIFGSA
jgi:hypothetical protein